MMFTITRCSEGDYTIGHDGHEMDGLAFDEMLGCIARLCLRGEGPRTTLPAWCAGRHTPAWTWTVTKVDPSGWYTIEDGTGRFIAMLTFDEMLGFVARCAITGKGSYGGFRTYEQWIHRFDSIEFASQKIAGLLPHYPNCTA